MLNDLVLQVLLINFKILRITMSPNQKLQKLYESKWPNLIDALTDQKTHNFANPFLIQFDEKKLSEADLRVAVYGQETKGWGIGGSSVLNRSVVDILKVYNNFFINEKYYAGYGRSSFWKAFRKINSELKKHTSKKIYLHWNNISKIGKDNKKTGIDPATRKIELEHFKVVSEEMSLLDPHIVIFLTGPNRDKDILEHFPDAKFSEIESGFSKRKAAQVTSENLPKHSYRIYHPSYFRGHHRALAKVLAILKSAEI